jgi:membrane protease YdiL (CAAX protease family)
MSTQAIAANPRPSIRNGVTWAGVFLSLFGMLLIRQVFRALWPEPSVLVTTLREISFWISGAVLVWIIRRGERLPLASIGIGTSRWWKSIAWGLVIAVLSALCAIVLIKLTGYGHGGSSKTFDKLPLWLVTGIVFRAGILEELFYRGYAMERLQSLGAGRWLATVIPLTIFAAGHWTGGWANIVIALVIGGILAGFYLWRRDLVSNMFAHTLVDFVSNVLPRMFA